MRTIVRLVKWLVVALIAVVIVGFGWLIVAPPDLLRVGAGYAAKIVCSNVFLAGRDPDEVLRVDVQAPGHPLLKLMLVDVDRSEGIVTAGLLGVIARSQAINREGLGCTSVPDGATAEARSIRLTRDVPAAGSGIWPEGNKIDAPANTALNAALDDPALVGPGMRAVVIVKDGRIVGERYGEGFSAETPLLGWSMTKTVTAALIGTLVGDGRLALDQADLLDQWRGDDRAKIRLSDLMAMSSGLSFNEDYGDVTDVTRMLYLEPDMGAYAASLPLDGPVAGTFRYSSGTTNILSEIWQGAAGEGALQFPDERVFGPLGMTSAVLETDESGIFAGSSYLYANGRDWARFAQMLLDGGSWNGRQILPPGYVAWMVEAAPLSRQSYGRGQVWLHGPNRGIGSDVDPDAFYEVPVDAFWMQGHDGQTIAIVPSERLVVLRMGLTPSKLRYQPQVLVKAAIDALR